MARGRPGAGLGARLAPCHLSAFAPPSAAWDTEAWGRERHRDQEGRESPGQGGGRICPVTSGVGGTLLGDAEPPLLGGLTTREGRGHSVRAAALTWCNLTPCGWEGPASLSLSLPRNWPGQKATGCQREGGLPLDSQWKGWGAGGLEPLAEFPPSLAEPAPTRWSPRGGSRRETGTCLGLAHARKRAGCRAGARQPAALEQTLAHPGDVRNFSWGSLSPISSSRQIGPQAIVPGLELR